MRKKQAGLLAIIGVIAAVVVLRCGSVPLTAPPGSSIFGQANPDFVIANGGTSVVTAMLTEPSGMWVPDGTNVYFFTDLGRIDDTVQTRNGVAHANFVSDSRSGTANVTIWSGGAAPAGNPSPSPTPTAAVAPPMVGGVTKSATGVVPERAVGAVLPMAVVSTCTSGCVQLKITVGSAVPDHLIVSASPDRITSPRRATIVANVFDINGNPVQNVPVVFAITGTGGSTPRGVIEETLASGGAPQYTDSNGQAFDVLITRAPLDEAQRQVTVTATAANGKNNFVVVFIN